MPWSDIQKKAHLADGWLELSSNTAVENPALYKAAMQTFIKVGAQILRPLGLAAVKLCQEIAPVDVQIWATLGPCGKLLALGEINAEELSKLFSRQIAELASCRPHLILLQGFSDLEESLIALQVAKETTDLPVGVSIEFGSGPDQTDTVMGQSCEDVARRLQEAGADLIGTHQGLDMDETALIVRLMREHSRLPILASPVVGQKELEGERIVYREKPDQYASKVSSLINAGANVIGGGVGATAEHIRAMKSVLTELNDQPPSSAKKKPPRIQKPRHKP